MKPEISRYDRQIKYCHIGESGQKKISQSKVLVIGCGALGSVIGELLARGGVGELHIVDRDILEIHNLQRQTLFNEDDVEQKKPKAIAAVDHLKSINSQITLEAHVADFSHANYRRFIDSVDLILDGTDNFETRHLINEVALEHEIPWIYGGAISADGLVKAVIPEKTSCLGCLMGPEPSGQTPTCETTGIIAPTSFMVASLQVSLALRILTGAAVEGNLLVIDAWQGVVRKVQVPRLPDCPVCVNGERKHLKGEIAGTARELCGSETVQIQPAAPVDLDLKETERMMKSLGCTKNRVFYLEFDDGNLKMNIFPDGRCLVKGTDDKGRARAFVSKYLGI